MRLTVRPGSHLAAAALVALMLAACGAGSPSPSPSPTTPSMVDGGSPSPAAATTRAPTPRPTATPAGDWPNGWDTAFCDAFEQVAISQELAVDVGRALDEDARDDALALARELEATGATAAELLGELVQWEPAQEAVAQLTQLSDLGQRAGRHYRRWLDDGRRQSRGRARNLAGDMAPVVEAVEAELAMLADEENVACPGQEFTLDAP